MKYNREKGFKWLTLVHIIALWELLIVVILGWTPIEQMMGIQLAVTVVGLSIVVQVLALEREGDE